MAVCALAPAPSWAQHPKPVATAAAARDFKSALQAIDARTSVGITFADYTRAMGDLKIAADSLDEQLQRRHADTARKAVADALTPYEEANTVWSTCVSTDACEYGLILMSEDEPLSKFVAGLLTEYPQIARPEADGGVLMDGSSTGRIQYKRLLGALWAIGADRAKALRSPL